MEQCRRDRITGINIDIRHHGAMNVSVRTNDAPLINYETKVPLDVVEGGDMVIDLPALGDLSMLKELFIEVNPWAQINPILRSDILCRLHNLETIELRRTTLAVDDPQCLALPNLERFVAANSTFIINTEGYENVLEMLAEHSPKLKLVGIHDTNITGSIPTNWLSDTIRLSLMRNDDMPDYETPRR